MTARRLMALLPSREVILTLALFAALLLAVLAVGRTTQSDSAYDPDAGGPRGLLGLRLWLAELGYRVEAEAGERFRLPAEARLLLVFPGVQGITDAEAAEVRRWIEAGGTLVLINTDSRQQALADLFGVRQRVTDGNPMLPLRPVQPWLPDAPAELGRLGLARKLDLDAAPAAVPVVAAEDGSVTAAVQRRGAGLVWHLTSHHDLTNAGLYDGRHGPLVLALLRQAPPGSLVVIDRFHISGPRAGQATTLQDWLWGTPLGWATAFGLAVVLLYLVLHGVRLGPPLPVVDEGRRREAAEYVSAMAGLQRRARMGTAVAAHHRRRLKRGLGRRYGVSPDLDDRAFLERLASVVASADTTLVNRAGAVLAELDSRPDEARLVRLVATIDQLLERR